MKGIVFRGKIKGNKTGYKELDWVSGDLVRELETGKYFIADLSHFDGSTKLKDVVIEVDPETVCQYTGLTDRNGRKIFEGDIIDDIDYGIMKCIYLHGSFVWYKEDGFRIECMRYVPKIEVIGNIFDNPELIGRQHDTNTWVM